jgi:hypothetical protein
VVAFIKYERQVEIVESLLAQFSFDKIFLNFSKNHQALSISQTEVVYFIIDIMPSIGIIDLQYSAEYIEFCKLRTKFLQSESSKIHIL